MTQPVGVLARGIRVAREVGAGAGSLAIAERAPAEAGTERLADAERGLGHLAGGADLVVLRERLAGRRVRHVRLDPHPIALPNQGADHEEIGTERLSQPPALTARR